MTSNDPISNAILHRANSKSDHPPFLVPFKDSLSTPISAGKQLNSNSKVFTAGSGRKSIKMLRPETIKRANNDACMAAAIGDLAWLQQTLKISDEIALDKNGFATIHLASIHGRINILKYLIEEKNFDPNYPSNHGWRPVHLCISNQIGLRAIECLNYLVEQGADLNVKNNDGVYPIHMAASEGQIECLKILLELKADTRVVDNRNQTPLDLARLWGHRTCAKLLSASIWHKDKNDITAHFSLVRKLKTQDVLKEIEQAHHVQFETKEEAEKKFDTWLTNQGFGQSNEENLINKKKRRVSSADPNKKKKTQDILIIDSATPRSKFSRATSHTAIGALSSLNTAKDPFGGSVNTRGPATTTAFSLTSNISDREFSSKKLKPVKNPPRLISDHDWNYSTKPSEKEYITNLNDFFPRDPFTKLPENLDLMLLNTELKGMTLDEVKQFMKKRLIDDPRAFKRMRQKSPGGIVDPSDQRPVYYAPKNIIDAQTKVKLPDDRAEPRDMAGFHLGNDINSHTFQEANRFIEKSHAKKQSKKSSSHGIYKNTEETLSQIKSLLKSSDDACSNISRQTLKNPVKDEKLEIVRKNFGDDLANFMTDKRHGTMSQKFEKVFIC